VHNDIDFEAITNLMYKYLYSYNITILYMVQTLLCSSSEGSIVYVQHLVLSLSVSGRTCNVRPLTESDGTRCVPWHATQHTHHNLTHMVPHYCANYNDVILLIVSTKKVTLARLNVDSLMMVRTDRNM